MCEWPPLSISKNHVLPCHGGIGKTGAAAFSTGIHGPGLPRRDADKFGQLRLGERCAEVIELNRVAHDARHVIHVVGLEGVLRVEGLDGLADEISRLVDLAGINLDRLRVAFSREGLRAIHLETPGFATMLGGILLVIPGFITDTLGAGLFLPAFRRWAGAAIGRAARRRPQDTSVIDLEPGEWHQIPDKAKKPRRKPNKPA